MFYGWKKNVLLLAVDWLIKVKKKKKKKNNHNLTDKFVVPKKYICMQNRQLQPAIITYVKEEVLVFYTNRLS